MDYNQLFEQIKAKKSFLCVGLDSDIAKIPPHLLQLEDPVFEFNKAVIDATAEVAIAYKPNIAFYESRGVEGWKSLEKTIHYIRTSYPDIFTIADAKRGDIGNTSQMYAKAFLETLAFDSITVAPYMGEDSVTPFLQYEGKWVVLLALTSNKGAYDFQFFESEGMKLYEKVLEKSQDWGNARNMMYVVGATKAEMLAARSFSVGAGSRSSGRKSRRSGKIWNECTLWLDSQFFPGHYFCRPYRKFCRTCTGRSV